MASNRTTRFALNQWAADDQVLREDFNRDNTILEAALDKLSFVIGTYTGTGINSTQTISLGFVPELVLVFQSWLGSANASPVAITPTLPAGDYAVVSGTTFQVRYYLNTSPSDSTHGANHNPFRYIAWRR